MQILKKAVGKHPKISLVLLDWSVRESFHLLHYLSTQTLPREAFEVIIIEYYSKVSDKIKQFEEQVDTWILLEMPDYTYYHKHLMYNVGIAYSQGDIIIICDSDAMVKPTFLQAVIDEFEKDQNIVLHLDQFRNVRRDLYPFCYPSFEEVIGEGCINYLDGKTTGLVVKDDLIHNRNYGACFCAKKEDLLAIGGADEHIDFMGHICGPYDLTFRLLLTGKREIWHESEFLYHTWHPGQAGIDNYLGPHDGRHISTTSLEALTNHRIYPHVMNLAISEMRKNNEFSEVELQKLLIMPEHYSITSRYFLESEQNRLWAEKTYKYLVYNGYRISRQDKNADKFTAKLLVDSMVHPHNKENENSIEGNSLEEIKYKIDNNFNLRFKVVTRFTFMYTFFYELVRAANRFAKKFKKLRIPLARGNFKIANLVRFTFKKLILIKKNLFLSHRGYFFSYKFMIINLNALKKQNKKLDIAILANSDVERVFIKILSILGTIPKIQIVLLEKLDLENSTHSLESMHKKIVFVNKKVYVENLPLFLNWLTTIKFVIV